MTTIRPLPIQLIPKLNDDVTKIHLVDNIGNANKSNPKDNNCVVANILQRDNNQGLGFLLTATQLDKSSKKKKVEECYFIDVYSILQDNKELLYLMVNDDNPAVTASQLDKMNHD